MEKFFVEHLKRIQLGGYVRNAEHLCFHIGL